MSRQEIIQWLDKMHIHHYRIHDDLSVTVKGGVNLSRKNLKSIPVQFREVEGVFNVSHNQLTSLKGSPSFCYGNFDCRANQLTTLEYAPKECLGFFDCGFNHLTTLVGAPEKVFGFLSLQTNPLTSLIGLPEGISCLGIADTLITSLEQVPTNLRNLVIDGLTLTNCFVPQDCWHIEYNSQVYNTQTLKAQLEKEILNCSIEQKSAGSIIKI